MNDTDRWINLEGPPPADVRRLLDAARVTRADGAASLTPERAARLERNLYAALAARERTKTRTRRAKVGAAAALVLACAGGALALALWALVVGADVTHGAAQSVIKTEAHAKPR